MNTMTPADAPFRLAVAPLVLALGLAGCGTPQGVLHRPLLEPVRQALAAEARPPAAPQVLPAVTAASATVAAAVAAPAVPPRDEIPLPPQVKPERRFSVVLNNASPEVVFMALLAETPLSVAVDPSVKGPISISLKDVTLREALDLLRELHGLDYKVIGRHILVSAAQLQTRIFQVDYPSFNRAGRSDVRVLSGSITGNGSQTNPGAANSVQGGTAAANAGTASSNSALESSRISTSQRNDLWVEIEATMKLLVGDKDGRSVVVSPQTGNIIVRALPREIRAVTDFLEAARLSVQRQVMLEAKIVEVQLSDSEKTGINWSAFKVSGSRSLTGGVIAPGGSLSGTGNGTTIGDGLVTVNPGVAIDAAATAAGSLLGLAIQTRNFAAVLDFLSTQGNTQVLSSPRIATLNNQKAVLKVGTDDFFVTSISSTTTAVGNTTATTPNIGVQPFFSGISLDVTPNIDAQGYITLHVHPSVSSVSERTKVISLGSQGSYSLPLASSEINESDAVVRALDGHIIAIGGLMRQAAVSSESGIPGTEGSLWRKTIGGQTALLSQKRELVILLKPTIIDPSQEDTSLRRDALQRLLEWTETQPAKLKVDAAVSPAPVLPALPAPVTPAAPAVPTALVLPSLAPVNLKVAPDQPVSLAQATPAVVRRPLATALASAAVRHRAPATAAVAGLRLAAHHPAAARGKVQAAVATGRPVVLVRAVATPSPLELWLRKPLRQARGPQLKIEWLQAADPRWGAAAGNLPPRQAPPTT